MTSFDQVARPPFSSNLSAPLVSTNMAAKFSSAQMAHSHYRQTSVASFASSLYLPVDPDNRPNLDDDADTYPSSDELFGVDHEEGDDYTISSRRHLSFSRYSTVFSQPPTPPRSTRSTMSLERSSSSLSLTSPPPRHGSADPGSNCSPSAWANRPAVIRTIAMTSATELPSPPSTARSSNEAAMSTAQVADQGVPIEKFEQLALEHLEQDRALLSMLQKLDEQKVRISQLTYALSRLRVLSNSACLFPRDADAPISGSTSAVQPRRLGAVIPKPLIVQQSTKSASSSTISGTGLSGPSQNEAVNQRRRAKQQLHEFALRRRPTRAAPKSRLGSKPAPETVKRRGWEWEGTRGSSSMVARDTMPRSAAMSVGHPNVTVRRPRRSEPVPQPIIKTPTRPPRPSVATSENAATPPRLASIFASPNRTPTQSRLSVHDSPNTQSRLSALFDSPIISLPPRKLKDKPLPLLPPTRPRKSSYSYELPPVPSPDHTTAHVTMVDRSRVTPPLPAEEIQHRLAATFAHFSHRVPSPTRRGTDVGPEDSFGPMDRREPDYLQEVFHRKWVAQVDEHAHQARGSWKSPLRSIKQRLVGGFGGGPGRKSSRASVSMSSSDDHGTSFDTPGYVHGLDTLQEKDDGDAKTKKSKKKSGKDKDKDDVPSTPKATKSTWRFSRLASSSS